MKRVYVAGRYSDTSAISVLDNIRKGIAAARDLLLRGYAPFCPFLDNQFIISADDSFMSSIDIHTFYDYSIAWLAVSDCMLLLPDRIHDSKGVQAEIAFAHEHNIPIFTSIDAIDEFFSSTAEPLGGIGETER